MSCIFVWVSTFGLIDRLLWDRLGTCGIGTGTETRKMGLRFNWVKWMMNGILLIYQWLTNANDNEWLGCMCAYYQSESKQRMITNTESVTVTRAILILLLSLPFPIAEQSNNPQVDTVEVILEIIAGTCSFFIWISLLVFDHKVLCSMRCWCWVPVSGCEMVANSDWRVELYYHSVERSIVI